jgi:membrane protease YdiL (CAAX protease family)
MEFPIQLVIFSLPSLIYAAVRSLRGRPFAATRRELGWSLCRWSDILRAIAVFALLAGMAFIAFKFIPADLLKNSSAYSGWQLSLQSVLVALLHEAVYVALGEEIFFRGFLGGILIRWLGFGWGNLLQAGAFLLPHLLLLNLGVKIWPVFLVQFAAGWLQGWLWYKSGSILPGWLVHTATNLSSALSVMQWA